MVKTDLTTCAGEETSGYKGSKSAGEAGERAGGNRASYVAGGVLTMVCDAKRREATMISLLVSCATKRQAQAFFAIVVIPGAVVVVEGHVDCGGPRRHTDRCLPEAIRGAFDHLHV